MVWSPTVAFEWDTDQYYSYLVAFFIEGDLSFNFPNNYWLHDGPLGVKIQKMSMGVALLEMPFFLLGHLVAKLGGYPLTGYSAPYVWSVNLGVLLYVFIGLNLLRKALLKFYSQFATSLTLVGVFIGTNLLYYTISTPTMGHSFLFFLFSALIYLTIRWHEDKKNIHLYLGVFVAGFIAVVRPNHAFAILIPVLYNVTSWESLKEKFKLIGSLKFKLIIALILFLIPIIPQLLYWKIYAGSWLYFSYNKEGFFFDNPQIVEFLFSYRKGWFIYTPIMLLAFVSMFFYKNKSLSVSSWVYVIPSIYIISSWWCWWYGASYGMRAMIDFYPLFAFPLAYFFDYFKRNLNLKILGVGVIALFVYFNLFGTIQYQRIIIHWDAMTRDSFWYSFQKISLSKDERAMFESLLNYPDYEKALEGERDIPHIITIANGIFPNNVSYKQPLTKIFRKIDFEDHPNKKVNGIDGSFCLGLVKGEPELVFNDQLGDLNLGTENELWLQSAVLPFNKESKFSIELLVKREGEVKFRKKHKWLTSWLGQKNWTGIDLPIKLPSDLLETDIIEVSISHLEGKDIYLDNIQVGLK